MLTKEEKLIQRKRIAFATTAAQAVLKEGDRIRVTKCPGTKRTITFAYWVGDEIISKSGSGEYCAPNIDRLNGTPVDFNASDLACFISAFPHYDLQMSVVLAPNEITSPCEFVFDVGRTAVIDHVNKVVRVTGSEHE